MTVNKSLVPPGGWHLKIGDRRMPAEGWFGSFDELVKAEEEYRLSNRIPKGDIERDVTLYVCQNWPHFCTGVNIEYIIAQHVVDPAAQPIPDKIMAWAGYVYDRYGKENLVDNKLANARANVCRDCPYNKPWEKACASCVQGVERITNIIRRGNNVENSENLGACSILGHCNKTAVWLNESFVPSKQELPNFCWAKK